MSRSKRKTPILGFTCAKSEKDDKRRANRKLRRIVKTGIRVSNKKALETYESLDKRDVSNVWSFEKDGKRYIIRNKDKKWMRK